jgi:hypothetical protein
VTVGKTLAGFDSLLMVVQTDLNGSPPAWTPELHLFQHVALGDWANPGYPLLFPHYLTNQYHTTLNDRGNDQTITTEDNFALAYVPEDHSPAPGTGHLEPWPGRLLLLYAKPVFNSSDREVWMAVSSPDDPFEWMRFGTASNGWRHLYYADELGQRGGFSLLAEPGVDANPRAAFKTNEGRVHGDIIFWPYVDGIRDVHLYDHNDWLVIRHYVCESIARKRCDHVDDPSSCDNADQRVIDVCGQLFHHPTTYQ